MPRRRQNGGGAASAFATIQRQARSLLSNLRKQIRRKEVELRRLKEEEARLGGLTGRATAASSSAIGRGRINWRTVLGQVPRQFKASDIRKVRGLKGKRPSEIFAAITRWIEAGLVKRRARGQYERA